MKRTKYYLSFHFLEAGAYFTKEALGYEKKKREVSDYYNYVVTSGIISIVTFLESYINEFYSEIVDIKGLSTNTVMINNKEIIRNLWQKNIPRTARFSILDKYEILLDITNSKKFDKSKFPYQDVNVLIKLRNALIHYEPEWQVVFENDSSGNLKKMLKDKFKLCPFYNKNEEPFFPYLCLSADCLLWAIECSTKLVSNFNHILEYSAVPLINVFKIKEKKVNELLGIAK